jgi:hypothetical protein
MYDLNSIETGKLIEKFRNGVPLTLICKQTHEGFSAAEDYPIQKVSMGTALEVLDDDGELVLLDEEYPGLDCFSVIEDAGQLAQVKAQMKEDALLPLHGLAERFLEKKSFNLKDVVKWIPGLQVMNMPTLEQPAVVLEILDEPVVDQDAELGDPSRSIRCDMIIGFMVDDRRMVTVLADSRRFQVFGDDQ